MKKTVRLLMLTLLLTVLCISTWHGIKEPKIQFKEMIKIIPPKEVEAYVSLTRWQAEKILKEYGDDAHPADMLKFKTIVKKDGEGWRISSTHLVKYSEPFTAPVGLHYVVDASYIDHHGDFKSCVEYANSYKDFHDYVVLSSE